MMQLRSRFVRAGAPSPTGAFRLALSLGLLLFTAWTGLALRPAQASPQAQAQALEFSTLRVHGYPAVGHPDDPPYANRPSAPGSNTQNDPITGLLPEEAPYTLGPGPFDPLSPEAPEMDFVTWNPAWISERLGEASLRADWPSLTGIDEVSEAANIRAGGVNASEKVWLRHWYEPQHLDIDLNADGRLTSDNNDQDYGFPLAPSNPTPTGVDEWYPAIMTEYTYMLVDNDPLPQSDPDPAQLGRSAPRATCGRVGNTRIVFPVGIEEAEADPAGPATGRGITSLDADFDDQLDMINVTDEATLPTQLGGLRLDFDGDATLDVLNPDGLPLTCDEMAVLHTDAKRISPGSRLQFLDHYVEVRSVTGSSALLDVYYTGDLVPRLIQTRTVAIGAAALAGDTGPLLVVGGLGGNNLGTVPPGAWFVYVQDVDADDDTAILMVGRALGAPCASMQQAPQQINLRAGGPYFLKRFYVDGHEFNVTAIYACDANRFQYITLRAPLPKVPVTLEVHSVRLQPHAVNAPLSLLPPFNHEHTILDDVDEAPEFLDLMDPTPIRPRPTILYMGGPVGPVPPILGAADAASYVPYTGRIPPGGAGPYIDPRSTRWFYTEETVDPAFIGQLREKYGAVAPGTDATPDRFFYNEQIFTLPYHYTEFVQPDLDEGAGAGAVNADDYLVTTAFTNPTSRWRRWRMPLGGVPDDIPPTPPDLFQNFSPDNGFPFGSPRRAAFWFDPDITTKLFYDQAGVRLYGGQPQLADMECDPRRPSLRAGAGDLGVTDPFSTTFPVEVAPYTDPFAPFNPQHPHAPRGDSLTFNPAYMDEFRNFGEALRALYGQLSNNGQNAREKVYHRSWYEPDYITKIRFTDDCNRDLSFPAVMQEFTYTYVDMIDQPAEAPVGTSRFGFPIGTTATELPAPLPNGTLPAGGEFGYGLTTFDANFDGAPDAVTIHNERTLATFLDAQWQAFRPVPPGPPPPVIPGPQLDFDGDGTLDSLNQDCLPLNGDEMVVFAVESLELDLDPNTAASNNAMVMDHLISLENVSRGGRAQVRFWFTGGNAGNARPEAVGGPQSLAIGDAAIVDRFQDSVVLVGPAGINTGTNGAWFAYIESVDADDERILVTVGRALGATHSAIDDGAGMHDLTPGDPWYLKRFYVDGHEYNVVALDTECGLAGAPDRFAFITIRTPVPKGNFFNSQDTLFQQGYFLNGLTPTISVMPPYNAPHTVVVDVERITKEQFADPTGLFSCVGELEAAPPLVIAITEEEREPRLSTELREIWDREGSVFRWITDQQHVTPQTFTELRLPRTEQALLTLNWTSPVSRLAFYGCTTLDPGPFPEGDVGLTHAQLAAIATGWAPPAGIIPGPNRDRVVDLGDSESATVPYYDARIGVQPVRVKLFYDPATARDPYVNPRIVDITLPADPRLRLQKTLSTQDPAIRGSIVQFTLFVSNSGNIPLTDVDLTDTFNTAFFDFVSATVAPTTVNEAGGVLTWDNLEAAATGGVFDPGEQIVIVVDLRATADTVDGQPALNTIQGDAMNGTVVGNQSSDDVIIRTPRLEIAKRLVTGDPTTVGSMVTYGLTLNNTGTAVLTDVDVSDNFDTAYLDFQSATLAPATVNEPGGLLTWNDVESSAPGGTFDPGEQITILVNFRAMAATPDPAKARNTARASALAGSVLTGLVSVELEVNPPPMPSLQLLKQLRSEDPTTVGSTVEYWISLSNNGNTVLSNVDLTDTFDTAYLDFVSASLAPTSINEAGGTVFWDNVEASAPGGTFDPGENILIIVRFRATAVTPDPQRAGNRASATVPGITVPPVTVTVEINPRPDPRVAITKVLTSPDPTTVGATVNFDINVTNAGNTVLSDVDVSDSFSTASLDFLAASLAPSSVNEAGGTLSWNNIETSAPGGSFDPGENVLIQASFRATAASADPVKAFNQADVAANAGTVLAGPARAEVEINRPAVSISKALTSANPTTVGSQVGFRITVQNTGDTELVDVNITDQYDVAFLTAQSAVPPAASTNLVTGVMTWLDLESAAPGGDFDPGEQIVIDLVFQAIAATPPGTPATNRVRVATNGGNVNAGTASASVVINASMLVSALSCQNVGPRAIELSWLDQSAEETGYEVQVAVGDQGFIPVAYPDSDSASTMGTRQTLLLEQLLPGMKHTFRLRSINGRTSDRSAWMEAAQECVTASAPPQTLGCVSGQVMPEGRVDFSGLALRVDGAPAGSTAADGSFRVCNVPVGTRKVTADGACFLRAEAQDTTVEAGKTTSLDAVALLGGDVNRTQRVDLFDLVQVGADFRTSPPKDEATDCSGDGTVNIFDLVMVSANYDTNGPRDWQESKLSRNGSLRASQLAVGIGDDSGPVALRQHRADDGELAVDIVLKAARPVYGADLELTFDAEQVAAVDAMPDWPETQIQPGPAWTANAYVARNRVDLKASTVRLAVSLKAPAEPLAGEQVLGTVRLRPLVDQPSATALRLTAVTLSDRFGQPIDVAFDGVTIETPLDRGNLLRWLILPWLGQGAR